VILKLSQNFIDDELVFDFLMGLFVFIGSLSFCVMYDRGSLTIMIGIIIVNINGVNAKPIQRILTKLKNDKIIGISA
jgi:hypothetical protein